MKQLRAKLFELELQKQNAEKQANEDAKSDIGWVAKSVLTCWMIHESRIYVQVLKTATRKRYSMVT